LTRHVDARCNDYTGFHTLGEDAGDVLKSDFHRLSILICDIHADTTIIDRNLHAEARRILASRFPDTIDLFNTWTDELLHRITKSGFFTLL
jgi:hypothetical protein